MVGEKVVYELGHWSPKYMLETASRITNFYCLKCRKVVYRLTMYEHFMTCCPGFIKVVGKYRRLEVGNVKQKRSNSVGTVGDREKAQKTILFSKPKIIGQIVKEVLSNLNFKETPE